MSVNIIGIGSAGQRGTTYVIKRISDSTATIRPVIFTDDEYGVAQVFPKWQLSAPGGRVRFTSYGTVFATGMMLVIEDADRIKPGTITTRPVGFGTEGDHDKEYVVERVDASTARITPPIVSGNIWSIVQVPPHWQLSVAGGCVKFDENGTVHAMGGSLMIECDDKIKFGMPVAQKEATFRTSGSAPDLSECPRVERKVGSPEFLAAQQRRLEEADREFELLVARQLRLDGGGEPTYVTRDFNEVKFDRTEYLAAGACFHIDSMKFSRGIKCASERLSDTPLGKLWSCATISGRTSKIAGPDNREVILSDDLVIKTGLACRFRKIEGASDVAIVPRFMGLIWCNKSLTIDGLKFCNLPAFGLPPIGICYADGLLYALDGSPVLTYT